MVRYSIAVANGHVDPAFPYISATGAHPPESCVFGQMLNIFAVIGLFVVYIRYRHVLIVYGDQPSMRSVVRINTAAFIVGITICLGISIVGNFQETNVLVVHFTGAMMALVVGFVYLLLQTIICHKTAYASVKMPGNTVWVRRVRVVLCVIDLIFLIIMTIASYISENKGPGEGKNKHLWSRDEPGYAEHVVATSLEWAVAIISMGFIATFYFEFKYFRVKAPN